jgi:hypothetical protein
MLLRFRKGQAFSEYAIFLGIILAAFMVMQHYLRNSVSGKLKAGADYMLTKGNDGLPAETFDPLASKDMTSNSETQGGTFNAQKDGTVTEGSSLEHTTQYGTQTWAK